MNDFDASVKLYKDVTIVNSVLELNCTVGDFSKVKDSCLHRNVRIDRNNHIDSSKLGRYSYTGKNSIILHADIGDFCSISWNVSIGGANHDYSRVTQHSFLYDKSDLMPPECSAVYNRFEKDSSIGSDVWIAANAVILRGVSVGHGAVIGANAVVTKDVPPYAIVAGVPAKIIKYRFDPEVVKKLLEIQWWVWSEEKIKANILLLADNPTVDNLKAIE